MRRHPEVIAKLAARGFTDMSLILVDVWTYGQAVMPERHRQRRLGAYPTQSAADTGISQWIKDDAPLENADVVLWYVFGIHHITRMEEWQVMPVDVVSFWLKPSGFFHQNPSLDAAPTEKGDDGTCHT